MIPQTIHWAMLVLCFFSTRKLPIPWFRAMLLCSWGEIVYRPDVHSLPWEVWLGALTALRIAAVLEAYSLVTLTPPWPWGTLAYWPLVVAAIGTTLAIVGATGYRPEFLYLRRYLHVWLGVFALLAISFVGTHRDRSSPAWAVPYAALVAAMMMLFGWGSLAYLLGLTGEQWAPLDRQLYLMQAAVLGGIVCCVWASSSFTRRSSASAIVTAWRIFTDK